MDWRNSIEDSIPIYIYIYSICREPRATVKQICTNGEWNIELQRTHGEEDLDECNELELD